MIFKIGILCRNKDYNLKDFDTRVHFEKSGWKDIQIVNSRDIIFVSPEGVKQRLIIPKNDFLINKIILPKGLAFDCYIYGFIPGKIDERIIEIEINLKSFNQKDKRLVLKRDESSDYKQLYDDGIWETIDMSVNY